MPLQRRVPKFGFKNINRVNYKAINVSMLQALAERDNLTAVDKNVLVNAGLISKNDLLKVLGDGALTAKLEVKADAFSKSAVAAIEAAGGCFRLGHRVHPEVFHHIGRNLPVATASTSRIHSGSRNIRVAHGWGRIHL